MVLIHLLLSVLITQTDFALGQSDSCPNGKSGVVHISGLDLDVLIGFRNMCLDLRTRYCAEANEIKNLLESSRYRSCQNAREYFADPTQRRRRYAELGCDEVFTKEQEYPVLMNRCQEINQSVDHLERAIYRDVPASASTGSSPKDTPNNLEGYIEKFGCQLKWYDEAHKLGSVTWRRIAGDYQGAMRRLKSNPRLSEILQEARRAYQFSRYDEFCAKYLPVPDYW